jgi:cytochrome b561
MPLRTRPEGYGLVARALHWATVAALVVQVVLGYTMDWDDEGGDRGYRGDRDDDASASLGARGLAVRHHRGRGGDDDSSSLLGDGLVTTHVVLGLTILALGVARLLWRRYDGLPAWDDRLTESDRRWATRLERTLLTLLVVAPPTGLLLVLTGEDDWLPLHVATHVALYVAVTAHLALVLRRGLLTRMLGGAPAS